MKHSMTKLRYRLFLLSLIVLFASLPSLAARRKTALDTYVATRDPAYGYKFVKTLPCDGCTDYLLEMTSQRWLTTAEVDRPLWKHWIHVVVPDKTKFSTAMLYISGGANDGKVPEEVDEQYVAIAHTTGAVVAVLKMVPNQPLVFKGDGKQRVEDAIIAFGWDKFLRGGDAKWLARLPMTKAAVRGMDTVTAFLKTRQGGHHRIKKFVVAGASKRGWTTWSTAAVDKRVVAIIPIVIDILNVEPSMIHHWRAYGFWSPAVGDYVREGVMDWFGSPRFDALRRISDPYFYRDRYTMPKFILNAAGDQFFLPDNSQFYFKDLPGEKHLRYVPNTDHSMADSDVLETLIACFDSVLHKRRRPVFSWEFPDDGGIIVHTAGKPSAVKLWQANDPYGRDFRLVTIGKGWKSTPIGEESPGLYKAPAPKPRQGWTAYFVELTYPSGGKYPFKFTTAVRVTPDTLPFPPPKAKHH